MCYPFLSEETNVSLLLIIAINRNVNQDPSGTLHTRDTYPMPHISRVISPTHDCQSVYYESTTQYLWSKMLQWNWSFWHEEGPAYKCSSLYSFSWRIRAREGYDMCAAKPVISQVAGGSGWHSQGSTAGSQTINLFPITLYGSVLNVCHQCPCMQLLFLLFSN